MRAIRGTRSGLILLAVCVALIASVSPARSQDSTATAVYDWHSGLWTKAVKLKSGKLAVVRATNLNRACYTYNLTSSTVDADDSTYKDIFTALAAAVAERAKASKALGDSGAPAVGASLEREVALNLVGSADTSAREALTKRWDEALRLLEKAESQLEKANESLITADSLESVSKATRVALCPSTLPRGLPNDLLQTTWSSKRTSLEGLAQRASMGAGVATAAVKESATTLDSAKAIILPGETALLARAVKVDAAIGATRTAIAAAGLALQATRNLIAEIDAAIKPGALNASLWLSVDTESVQVVLVAKRKTDDGVATTDTLRPPVERRFRMVLAVGPAWTTANSRNYERGKALRADGSAVTVIQKTEDSNSDVAPLSALLHFQIWRDLFVSVGTAARTVNKGRVLEPIGGVSMGFGDRFFLTAGMHWAAGVELREGFTGCEDSGIGDTAACRAIPDAIDRADFTRETHDVQFTISLSTRAK